MWHLLAVLSTLSAVEAAAFLRPTEDLYPYTTTIPLHVEESSNNAKPPTVNVRWNIDHRSETVRFEVEFKLENVNEYDWFAFGLNGAPKTSSGHHGIAMDTRSELLGADLCLMTQDTSQYVPALLATHGTVDNDGYIVLDKSDTCAGSEASYSRRRRSIMFTLTRAFNTGIEGEYVIQNGTTHLAVVFGRNSGDMLNIYFSNVAHGVVPTRLIHFASEPKLLLDEDTFGIDITMDSLKLPAQETTYWCYVTKLTKLAEPLHIIGFKAIIEAENDRIVHHMEVYHCDIHGKEEFHFSGQCDPERLPPSIKTCRRVLGAWAMGADPVYFPPEAGTLLDVSNPSFSPYVMLEIHYHNPEKRAGVIDNSGMRFFVTPNLRLHDAGVMEIGIEYNDLMAIPPAQNEFKVSGVCTSACTNRALPPQGIHIFASQLHSHLLGRKLGTKVRRSSGEIVDLNVDNHYNPNWQEVRPLREPFTLLPGDSLLMTCMYDSSARNNVTLSGLGINDEMCVNYMHYYPKVDLEVCKSAVSQSALTFFFDLLRASYQDDVIPERSNAENYRHVKWSQETSIALQFLYEKAPVHQQCLRSNGDSFPGAWESLQAADLKKIL